MLLRENPGNILTRSIIYLNSLWTNFVDKDNFFFYNPHRWSKLLNIKNVEEKNYHRPDEVTKLHRDISKEGGNSTCVNRYNNPLSWSNHVDNRAIQRPNR